MRPRRFALASFLVAVVGGLVAAFAPLGQMESVTSTTDGSVAVCPPPPSASSRPTAPGCLVVVSVPVLVCLVALPPPQPSRDDRFGGAVVESGASSGCCRWACSPSRRRFLLTLAASRGETAPIRRCRPSPPAQPSRPRELCVKKLTRPLPGPTRLRRLAVVETSSAEKAGRRWRLPRPAALELAFTLARVAVVGLVSIALSGVVAGVFGSAFGRSFRRG